jgi:DNA polymerase/3'-5' exonuclease PolX
MNLDLAQNRATKLVDWLRPSCERIEIAGSIRRQRPECADIDLVIIPKCTVYVDMFGVETGRQNHAWMHLVNYVNNAELRSPVQAPNACRPHIDSGDGAPGRRMTIQLYTCQLDIWFANESTWGSTLIHATGSKEHNIWIAERANQRNGHWRPFEGLTLGPTPTETELYRLLGLAFIDPLNRELPWLNKHLNFGL